MPPTRKSPPPRRTRDSQRVALKLRARSSPTRVAGERRPSTPSTPSTRAHEPDPRQAAAPIRTEADPLRNVIDVVTADLTRDPRHEK